MKLRGLQADFAGDAGDLVERGLEEDAHQRHGFRQRGADGLRFGHADAALAARNEDDADLVRARLRAEQRIGGCAHAAELDPGHARTRSRTAASGSRADESASPTSTSEAPSSR